MSRQSRGWKSRAAAVIGVCAMTAAGAIIAAPPASAATVVYSCGSNWFEAYGGLTATGNNIQYRAYAQLGNSVAWGATSSSNTSARRTGFSTTHDGKIFRGNTVFCD
ncbi:hypothetical protein [Microbacterium proteolyticum]|uniref:hypothetical protein n=1 Tax=Microbacterium proteolyticum TaxID=1572644 RepID=UPI0035C0C283